MRLVDVRVFVPTRASETVERARRTCENSLVARSHAVQVRLEGQDLRARAQQTLSERHEIRQSADGTAGEANSGQRLADPSARSAASSALEIATR